MTYPKTVYLLLFLALFLILPQPAQAHRVRIFAYEHGGIISTEAKFSGGRPAKNAEILIQNSQTQKTLLTGRTNEEGIFTFPVPEEARREKLDLNIIINIGEGHKNQWQLSAKDYLGTDSETPHPPHSPENSKVADVEETPHPSGIDETHLQKIVEDALDKKLAPIKRMLAENLVQKPRLHDVLGGLGYILGLAGLVAYFRSRKNGDKVKKS